MISPFEIALLEAYESLGAVPSGPPARHDRVLARLTATTTVAPRFGYELICDLARPSVVHLPLVRLNGNPGGPGFSAADARYTEGRLSVLGALALASARGERPALPFDLVNGNLHLGGTRPPFAPAAVERAVRVVHDGGSPADVRLAIGPPAFASGCAVDVDLDALHDGDEVILAVRPVITIAGDLVVLRHVPHELPPLSAVWTLQERAGGTWSSDGDLPITDIDNPTSGDGPARFEVRVASGTAARVARALEVDPGLHEQHLVRLGAPIEQLLANWLARHAASLDGPWQGTELSAALA